MPWLVGITAVVLLFLFSRSQSEPSLRAVPPVALVGDSIAVGLSGPLGEQMGHRGLAFFSDAEVGTSARQWVGRIDRVLARGPRTVIVNLGGNDAASDVLTREFAANIRSVVDKVRAAGAQAILLEPPSRPSPRFAIVQHGLRSTGAPVLVPGSDFDRVADGVHFTAEGYREWARAISGALA